MSTPYRRRRIRRSASSKWCVCPLAMSVHASQDIRRASSTMPRVHMFGKPRCFNEQRSPSTICSPTISAGRHPAIIEAARAKRPAKTNRLAAAFVYDDRTRTTWRGPMLIYHLSAITCPAPEQRCCVEQEVAKATIRPPAQYQATTTACKVRGSSLTSIRARLPHLTSPFVAVNRSVAARASGKMSGHFF